LAALTPSEAAGDLDETQLLTSSDGMTPVNGIIAGCSMFQRMIDDFKDSTGTALRLAPLAALAASALLITTSFLLPLLSCLCSEIWIDRSLS
jgi:hypothetical protein